MNITPSMKPIVCHVHYLDVHYHEIRVVDEFNSLDQIVNIQITGNF